MNENDETEAERMAETVDCWKWCQEALDKILDFVSENGAICQNQIDELLA